MTEEEKPLSPKEGMEAVKFNLEQADNKFIESLKSATDEDEVRGSIEDLHAIYSDGLSESSDDMISVYILKYINTLQNLKTLPKELQQTIDINDYELVNTILEGLPDKFFDKEDELLEELPHRYTKPKNEPEGSEFMPSNQWGNSIDKLFEELGVFNKKD